MPDPHKDLADIIEPQIAVLAATSSDWQIVAAAVSAGLVIAAGFYWYWRRNAPLRSLRRLRILSDPQQAADALADMLPHFKPQPEAAWLDQLQRLRFGPPQTDSRAILDALCQQVEALLPGRK